MGILLVVTVRFPILGDPSRSCVLTLFSSLVVLSPSPSRLYPYQDVEFEEQIFPFTSTLGGGVSPYLGLLPILDSREDNVSFLLSCSGQKHVSVRMSTHTDKNKIK